LGYNGAMTSTSPAIENGEHIPLLAVVGPTASGKTALGIALAQALGGEIVSADSRQIYREMDIGTAKPTPAERALVPHHLLDVVAPKESFTLADYQAAATAAIADIHARGRLPILVGGTGLYIRAVVDGLAIPAVAPDAERRAALEVAAERDGAAALHAQLATRDPEAAAKIPPANVRRVIRALEVIEATGEPFSAQQNRVAPPYAVTLLGLNTERARLYTWADARVEAMLAAGFVAEVERLVARGYGWELPAMSGLGYREIGAYLRGEMALADAVQRLKFATHGFIRKQLIWFRPDTRIHWLDAAASDVAEQALTIYAASSG
jgi:tRNA dimethylallyltransferase